VDANAHARAGSILLEIGNAAHKLHVILAREATEFEPFWRALVLDAYRLAASPELSRAELEDVALRIANGIGIGLGSLADLVLERGSVAEMERLNDELEDLRCRLGFAASRLRNLQIESEVDPHRLRASLAQLENTFVEERAPEYAARCRALLTAPEVDCFATCGLLYELSRREWPPGLALRLGYALPAITLVLKPFIEAHR
jgi:hypothetical protein